MDEQWRGGGSTVDVVALVASAGGLEALTTVLKGLPVDLPAAMVVQQHLSGQGSRLVPILRARTGREIGWAVDGAFLEPGRVLVAPGRRRLEVLPDGSCAVGPAELDARGRPHDVLLASLADSYGARGLAVVLTGMGRDGAVGVRAVKDAGGIVLVQDEDTAEQPSMPRAAAEAGADLVLPLQEIAGVVTDVVRGERLPLPHGEVQAIRDVFGTEGVMASIAREVSWSRTPVGPVTGWSPVLRAMVRLMMACPDPALVFWGADLLFFSNDAAVPLIGGRERTAFARPYRETFAEVFDQVAPTFEQAMRGKPARYLATPFRYVRDGRLQDTWVDFTDTPIWEQDGAVAGLHRVFYERTAEVLAARRLATLNALGGTSRGGSRRQAIAGALKVLGDAADVPFAAVYLLDAPPTRASLVGTAGVEEGRSMAPREVRLAPGGAWPFHEALAASRPVLVDDVAARFHGHVAGVDGITPECAFVYPLRDDAEDGIVGMLILGTEPYLLLDDRYREFLTLVSDTIAARMAEAHARQRERQRLEHLAELDRAKTEFFSNVSHEFRTPLTLMLGPLEELLNDGDGLPAERKAELELIRRNARRLLRLVATMLDFSQIEAGRLRARFAPVDLTGRTQEIVAQFESAAARAGLALRVELEKLPDPVWVDVEMWEKIVSNLLSNALKFTFSGEIAVTLRTQPNHAELVIRDTGVGIPQEELPHVFQRFHRVRDTRARTYEGAGIGLALVYELVRRHHGRIRAASTLGEGSKFTVWIPLGRRPAPREAPPPGAPATAVAAAMAEEAMQWGDPREPQSLADDESDLRQSLRNHAPGARVLVADDNNDMLDYLTRLLSSHWSVETAPNGSEALALARRTAPDLVLADVMMPGLDGFGLLRELRHDPDLSATPVVLVTARAGEQTAIEGLLAGANDYIVKPFSARELVARVGAQLELSRTRRAAEERLRRVLETDNVGVLYFDYAGTVVDANQVFLGMSGYTRAEIERGELTWRRMTPPEWTAISEQQMQRLNVTGRIGPYEKEYVYADGTRRWMLFAGRDLGDGTIGEFCVDITDLKTAETPRTA